MSHTNEHKLRLKDYFDGDGFRRWSAIYGEGELSHIRRTIRDGHARMLGMAEHWLEARFPASALATRPTTLLDAGCGTGLFAVAQARRGFSVTALDIAPQMVAAAAERARSLGVSERVRPHVGDVDELGGVYDAVVCFDVLIHYPRPALDAMLASLARSSRGPLLFTYAPHEPVLAGLHWLGGLFPRASRRTDIQMTPRRDVHAALAGLGMAVRREAEIRSGFYHVNLVEAERDRA
jgi:magnesium-protoporphyrin O-methyltransferase